ncbi:MAG: type II secretion system F family protein [Verrucomicrobiota bacterium]
MFAFLELFFSDDSNLLWIPPLIEGIFWYAVYFFLPILFGAIILHALFSLPLRRRERARFFLDLIETSLAQGQSVEHTIVSAAESRDRSVGVRFHLLAAYLESGLPFGNALQEVPRFLPAQISRILRVGEKLGDIRLVLPACRETLRGSTAFTRSLVQFIFLPLLFFPIVTSVLVINVLPKIREIAAGTGEIVLTDFSPLGRLILLSQFILSAILVLGLLLYVGGPRFVRWFRFRDLPFADWMAWRVPWKQKQMQRTFSSMLAVLLDSGVPELEAVQLASDCTNNEIFSRRSRKVIAALERGEKLTEAVRALDDSDEFHWRLTNAVHARGGFLAALRGWHEALTAKAFQQEEAAAHIFTSGVIVLNGVLVALIAVFLFNVLTSIIEKGAL